MTRGSDSPASTPSTLAPQAPGEMMPTLTSSAAPAIMPAHQDALRALQAALAPVLTGAAPVMVILLPAIPHSPSAVLGPLPPAPHDVTLGQAPDQQAVASTYSADPAGVISDPANPDAAGTSQRTSLPPRQNGESQTDYAHRVAREMPASRWSLREWSERIGIPARQLERAIEHGVLSHARKPDGRNHGLRQIAPAAMVAFASTLEAVREKKIHPPKWLEYVQPSNRRSRP